MTISDLEIQTVKQRFGIIGNSPLLNNAVSVAIQVSPTDMSVLITGESGSGKESFSKIIHTSAPVSMASLSQSTVAQFPKAPLTPNYLAMKRARSLALMRLEKDISR